MSMRIGASGDAAVSILAILSIPRLFVLRMIHIIGGVTVSAPSTPVLPHTPLSQRFLLCNEYPEYILQLMAS